MIYPIPKKLSRFALIALCCATAGDLCAKETQRVPAFPGAEGFGAYAVGGRGGAVMIVTTLADYDSGETPIPGSLRAAVEALGPRTVVFRVSGQIELKRFLEIRNPYITIAGQTAPGDGVSIRNYGIDVDAPHVVLRYLRVRPGDVSGEEMDAINIRSSDVIVDHCSASWATDETVSVIEEASNVTVQWSLITESLNASVHVKGEHGYGSLISTPGSVSIHHNVYAFHKSRNPRPRDVLLDFRNNLVYGWGDRAGYNVDDSARINYVGNYLIPLSYSDNQNVAFTAGGNDTRLFLEGNILRQVDGSQQTGWGLIRAPGNAPMSAESTLSVSRPFPVAPVATHSAQAALDLVLADAGATRPGRDAVDRRVVDLIRAGTGRIIDSQNDVGGWQPLEDGPASADSDLDGMSDAWEDRFGLDNSDGRDHNLDLDGDGYTNLEEYLNGTNPAVADELWSVRMAESVMARNPTLMERWHYEVGLIMKAVEDLHERTGDTRYIEYIRHNIDQFVQPDGSIRTYELDDYNLDQIAAGKLLFGLYERTDDTRYRRAADTLRLQLAEHPRTREGGFWHKQIYPWQLWLDGVYMAGPFLVRYGTEFDDPVAIDEVANEILLVARYLRDPKTGLYYHGWDESREQSWSDPVTGLSKSFWGRGMGWFGMALVDVLDYLPDTHRDRDVIIRVLRDFAHAVAGVQDPVSGLWYQVLDQPQRPENYLEASASGMFIYTLAKGVRMGYLEHEYLAVAQRAYEGVLDRFVEVAPDGHLDFHGTVSVGGLGGDDQRDGTFEYYMSEPIRVNDNKGVGPFIMASLELEAFGPGAAKP
jgi:unsaturated rhamnogalacturonyl hydrolase